MPINCPAGHDCGAAIQPCKLIWPQLDRRIGHFSNDRNTAQNSCHLNSLPEIKRERQSAQLLPLPRDPCRCSSLRVPGLKQLLGQHLQLLCIKRRLNGSVHPFNIKLLSDTQADGFLHASSSTSMLQLWRRKYKRIVSSETNSNLCVHCKTKNDQRQEQRGPKQQMLPRLQN